MLQGKLYGALAQPLFLRHAAQIAELHGLTGSQFPERNQLLGGHRGWSEDAGQVDHELDSRPHRGHGATSVGRDLDTVGRPSGFTVGQP